MLNKTEKKAIEEAVRSGFTYTGDAIFNSYAAGVRCIRSLVRKGYLVPQVRGFQASYAPTQSARDFVSYGIESGDVE